MKQVYIWACEEAQMNNTDFKLRFVVIVRQFPLCDRNKGLVFSLKNLIYKFRILNDLRDIYWVFFVCVWFIN